MIWNKKDEVLFSHLSDGGDFPNKILQSPITWEPGTMAVLKRKFILPVGTQPIWRPAKGSSGKNERGKGGELK